MLTIFWNVNGFPIVKVLPDNEKFTAEYFMNEILEELYKETKQIQSRGYRKVVVHYDNARPHTARKVIRYLEEHLMKKAPHPHIPLTLHRATSACSVILKANFKVNISNLWNHF